MTTWDKMMRAHRNAQRHPLGSRKRRAWYRQMIHYGILAAKRQPSVEMQKFFL